MKRRIVYKIKMYKMIISYINENKSRIQILDYITESVLVDCIISNGLRNSIYNYMYGDYACGSLNLPITSTLYRCFLIIYPESDEIQLSKISITNNSNQYDKNIFIKFDDIEWK